MELQEMTDNNEEDKHQCNGTCSEHLIEQQNQGKSGWKLVKLLILQHLIQISQYDWSRTIVYNSIDSHWHAHQQRAHFKKIWWVFWRVGNVKKIELT